MQSGAASAKLHTWSRAHVWRRPGLVPKIRMLALIIHGTDDWMVSFWMGRRLKDGFEREATFVPMERGGHNDLREDELGPPVLQRLKANAGVIGRGRGA